jgi:methionyl-tRNA formyltransferase
MIKTIFMGKHSGGNNNCLGVDALNYLLTNNNFNIVRCILNEKDLLYDFCIEHSIDFGFDVNKIIEDFSDIDLIISYGFKDLIKEPLINVPRIGCINFHPAPLPDWRGMGGVFNFALYEQVDEWGVSAHFVDNSFDTGDLIKVNNFKINSDEETVYSLSKKSHKELIKLFYEVMNIIISYKDKPHHIPRKKQVGGRYVSKSDFNILRKINRDDTTDIIDRKIKAFFHPPQHGAFIELNNKEYSLINNEILNKIKIEE